MSLGLIGANTADAAPIPPAFASALVASNLRHIESASDFPTPANQMKSLNFLLGEYKCVVTPVSGTGFTIYETGTKILGGNYYQFKFNIPGEISGYQTFGWNPVDQDYITQEFDDAAQSGSQTSPGWTDGKLNFLGTYVFVEDSGGSSGVGTGLDVTEQDSWVAAGPGHHFDYVSIIYPGTDQWVNIEYYDCRIVR
jgi:hypothetical protein